jgi:hypothetical protein
VADRHAVHRAPEVWVNSAILDQARRPDHRIDQAGVNSAPSVLDVERCRARRCHLPASASPVVLDLDAVVAGLADPPQRSSSFSSAGSPAWTTSTATTEVPSGMVNITGPRTVVGQSGMPPPEVQHLAPAHRPDDHPRQHVAVERCSWNSKRVTTPKLPPPPRRASTVRALLRADGAELAVGSDDVGGYQVVDRQSEFAVKPANPRPG